MRNIFIALFIAFGALFSAQNISKKDFIQKVNQLNVVTDYQELSVLEKDFIKIINQDKTWYSYYYTAMVYIQEAKMKLANGKKTEVNGCFQTALKNLMPIYSSQKNNVEVNALVGVIYFLKSKYSVKNNFKYKNEASKYFKIAKMIDANNDRVLLLNELLSDNYSKQDKPLVYQASLNPIWGGSFLGALTARN